jgi:hypothetical protein
MLPVPSRFVGDEHLGKAIGLMPSPEIWELTFIIAGALRLVSVVLDIVPRSCIESTSSREQTETSAQW